MSFNPYTWNNIEPLPGQFVSAGQGTILNDINFLGSTFGLPISNEGTGFIQFPSGFIVQWTLITSLNSGNNTVDFQDVGMQYFPAYCFGGWVQYRGESTSGKSFGISDLTPPTRTQVVINAANGTTSGVYLLVIGR